MKKIIACILGTAFLLSFALILTSCDPVFRYEGEHVELEATAIYSVPGSSSDSLDEIQILETDDQGRVLFVSFMPHSWLGFVKEGDVLSVVIVQKVDDGRAYFYGEKNYLLKLIPDNTKYTEELVHEYFNEQEIAELKAANSWNEPFSENEEFDSAPITLEKNDVVAYKIEKKAQKELEKMGYSNTRTELLRTDENGKMLYYYLYIINGWGTSTYEWYVAMFNADGTLVDGKNSILQLDKNEDIGAQIMEFRTRFGWEPCDGN